MIDIPGIVIKIDPTALTVESQQSIYDLLLSHPGGEWF
jgi:hypothetical protein